VQRVAAEADLGFAWSAQRLAHQLDYRGVPRTLVVEQDGRVKGFLEYHRRTFLGRAPLAAAVIDLLIGPELSNGQRGRLLQAALAGMAAEGVQLATMLRPAPGPRWPLLRRGFIPTPHSFLLGCLFPAPDVPQGPLHRMYLDLR
jgi:hypothetical protein